VTSAPVTLIEGLIAVMAALEADSRPIQRILIDRERREYEVIKLVRRAAERGAAVERVSAAEIDALTNGKTHGGVAAWVGERRFVTLEALLPAAETPFIAMLDGVEDPYNFGQAVRALYAAGAHGLVVRPRNWMSAAGVVARASAGASERIPTAVAETVEAAALFYRAHGLKIALSARDRAVSIYDADLTVPLFLVIGGEKRGVTRSFADAADMRLKIPYGRAFPLSLGTTAAAAALAFEIMRQRMASRNSPTTR
jgi:23S rRNA (guanosine2251-2'-O)-methyltransferase